MSAPGLNFTALSGQPFGYRAVTAAGSAQGSATALATYSAIAYLVSGANGSKGVLLPAASAGKFVIVKNLDSAAANLLVYPNTSGTINGGSANASYTLGAGESAVFVATSTTAWFVIASAAGGSSSLPSLTSAHIFVGNGSNLATDVALSGDVSIDNTGASTVGAISTATGISVSGATTPQISTATGKTNTGYFLVNGKTSGSVKLTTADATGQAVTISPAAQTVGAVTLTTPDFAGVNDTFAFITKAQTISNKTFDVTNIDQSFKTLSTQTFTSNATLTNLTGLSWAVAAGGTYFFDLVVPLLTETVNGGAQMAFKLTTATLTQVNLRVNETTDTDNAAANVSTSFTSTTDQATWFNQKTTVFTHVHVCGSFTVGTGGSIAIQAAQNTSAGGGDATIFAGTAVVMTRTA